MQVAILIGNTDNKLTQQRWNAFVEYVDRIIRSFVGGDQIHFSGGPPTNSPYQNYCWVFTIPASSLYAPDDIVAFKNRLTSARQTYNQDSIAWLHGDTEFI